MAFDEIINLAEGAHELAVAVHGVPGVSGGPYSGYGSAAVELTATATFPVAVGAGDTLPWSRVKALYR